MKFKKTHLMNNFLKKKAKKIQSLNLGRPKVPRPPKKTQAHLNLE